MRLSGQESSGRHLLRTGKGVLLPDKHKLALPERSLRRNCLQVQEGPCQARGRHLGDIHHESVCK